MGLGAWGWGAGGELQWEALGGGGAVQGREQPDSKARRTGLPSRSSNY